MIINTTKGEMDDSLLERLDGSLDNDNETTSSVEYCLKNCPGEAHKTGVADGLGYFCSLHVHRSVHVVLKRPVSVEGVAASFA